MNIFEIFSFFLRSGIKIALYTIRFLRLFEKLVQTIMKGKPMASFSTEWDGRYEGEAGNRSFFKFQKLQPVAGVDYKTVCDGLITAGKLSGYEILRAVFDSIDLDTRGKETQAGKSLSRAMWMATLTTEQFALMAGNLEKQDAAYAKASTEYLAKSKRNEQKKINKAEYDAFTESSRIRWAAIKAKYPQNA